MFFGLSWSRVLVGVGRKIALNFGDAGSAIAGVGRVMEFHQDLGRSKLLKTRQMRLFTFAFQWLQVSRV
jgi:hypothetical protein